MIWMKIFNFYKFHASSCDEKFIFTLRMENAIQKTRFGQNFLLWIGMNMGFFEKNSSLLVGFYKWNRFCWLDYEEDGLLSSNLEQIVLSLSFSTCIPLANEVLKESLLSPKYTILMHILSTNFSIMRNIFLRIKKHPSLIVMLTIKSLSPYFCFLLHFSLAKTLRQNMTFN